MKKGKLVAILTLTIGLLTGCVDNMPDMTQEENDLVAEYAADLLLKYSPNYSSRLVDVSDIPMDIMIEETTQEEIVEQQSESEQIDEKDKESVEITEQETEVIQEKEEIPDNLNDVDLAEIFSIDDLSITYADYDICDMYPTKGTGFGVSASKKHKLLVLHFTTRNNTSDAVSCDLFEVDPQMTVKVNGAKYKALNTLLENDLTVYIDDIPGNTEKDLVALFEIDAEEDFPESFILQISNANYYVE